MATSNPSYSVYGGGFGQDQSSVQAMRGRTRFDITVRHQEIKETYFGDHYLPLLEAMWARLHDLSARDHIDYICEYCLPLMEQLAPQVSFKGLKLEDLLHSPLYALEIVKTDIPGDTRIVGADRCTYSPANFIAPLETVHLPPGCDAIPRFAASQISLDNHDPSRSLQGGLFVPDGRYMHFKPREDGRQEQFDRELRILCDIKRQQLAGSEIRLPDLQGIVVSGEADEKFIGLLIAIIPASSLGIDLLSAGCWTNSDLHMKWEQQVTTTVEVLHAHGIVWGDVNAGNVVIDQAFDAWVIDFGGRNNPEFVDDDKVETIDGDWQGVRRLFQVWLANRRAGVPL
ncbi:hypothetical protein LTS08_001332 [Lithohypha guttulata]|uniref:uncharacterized protein n=1 Tax=Lithohypha guttulata TaxID=1690604 RepID=UPI002DDF3375|nr:hypothetical protein LTR51_004002 [Lithohypha guttulata]KAK5105058.1 hypothetical protein LTS08_001332 [Lithohypha guttulata]